MNAYVLKLLELHDSPLTRIEKEQAAVAAARMADEHRLLYGTDHTDAHADAAMNRWLRLGEDTD